MIIQQFYKEKLENGRTDGKGGLSPTSVLYIHRVLNEALNHAVKVYNLLSRNPMDNVKPPKKRKARVEVYNENELTDFLHYVKDHKLETAAYLAFGLGMRRGEILGLTWSNVDLNNKKIFIRETLVYTKETGLITKPPKSEESIRDIDLPDTIVDILKNTQQRQEENRKFFKKEYIESDYVICEDNGILITPNAFSKRFKTLINNFEIDKKTTLHGLRHAWATIQLKYGTPLKVVSSLIGHSTGQITQDTYQHALEDMNKEAAKKMDEGIFKELKKNHINS